MGAGVHTSRVVRNSKRIGEAFGLDVKLGVFSAMNLPIDNKDSLVFMYVIFLNRLQKYKKE